MPYKNDHLRIPATRANDVLVYSERQRLAAQGLTDLEIAILLQPEDDQPARQAGE